MDKKEIVLYSVGLVLTLVQISPLKINPWSWVGRQIKNVFVGDISEKLDKMAAKIDELESRFSADKIASVRWRVLDFGNSCLQGRRHTKEEWDHCISELSEYEHYCRENKIDNGVMEEMAKYLRKNYQERWEKKDFL